MQKKSSTSNEGGISIKQKFLPTVSQGLARQQAGMRGKLTAFLVCLVISAFLWISHSLNRYYNYSLSVPVKFINLPANKMLLAALPENLRFDIKTSGLKLFFVLMNKPFTELLVDFNSLKGDNKLQSYSISSGNLNLKSSINFDVEVKRISPDTLFFINKKGTSKNVAVKPLISINAESGFVISKPVINPTFITINGDSSVINDIDSISTVPLFLNNLNKNYSGTLALVKPSENIFLNLNEINITVTANRILQKELELSLEVINKPSNAHIKLFPGKVKISFSSASSDFSEINENSFKAVVNFSKSKPGDNKLGVELSLAPTNAHIISIEPNEVEFLIFKTQ